MNSSTSAVLPETGPPPDTTGKKLTVETGGARPVAPDARHGHPRQLLWTWASPQVGWATVYIGVLAVAVFGLSFRAALCALVLGAGLGSLAHAALSTDGPRFGVPQMVLGRLSFGRVGNTLPSTVNALVSGIGWFAMNTLGGAFALNSLTGLPPLACLLLLVALEVVVGYVGHDLVHRFEKYALPVLAVIFLLAGVWIFKGAHPGHPGSAGGGFGPFLLAFSASFGFTAGWNPCASDYSRYLPAGTPRRATALYSGLGLFLSVSVVSVIGAASGTVVAPAGASPTDAFTGQLPGWLAHLTLLAIIIGAMAASTLNVYSAAVSLSSLVVRLPRFLNRATLTALTGAVGAVAGWASLSDAGHAFESFLLVIAYWTAPWLGVVLVEQWLRRHTPDTLIRERLTSAAHSGTAGLTALLAGVAVSVPLFCHQEMYVGPLPAHWPGLGDLTCPVGFAVSAGLYAALRARRTA